MRRGVFLDYAFPLQQRGTPRPYIYSLKAEWGYLLPLDSTHEVDEIEAGKEAQAVAPIIYFANDADIIGEACRAAGIGDACGVEDGDGEWYLLELMTCKQQLLEELQVGRHAMVDVEGELSQTTGAHKRTLMTERHAVRIREVVWLNDSPVLDNGAVEDGEPTPQTPTPCPSRGEGSLISIRGSVIDSWSN